MIQNDLKIDFKNKKISYIGKDGTTYPAIEFYSFLQDIFDEQENMKYEIPIVAKSKTVFKLINGWTIDATSLKYIKGNLQTI